MNQSQSIPAYDETIQVKTGKEEPLEGHLEIPVDAAGVVIFAHGSGSSRHSPRNRQVAADLVAANLGTLLIDLLTSDEEEQDRRTREYRFNIPLLAERVIAAIDWIKARTEVQSGRIGLFGASTGAAAALIASASRPDDINAVVSRGGRPDLANSTLINVQAPVLLIVGEQDLEALRLNQQAQAQLKSENRLVTVAGATHLFEEPGALEKVSQLAREWFLQHLA